jgi:hypothetical protein
VRVEVLAVGLYQPAEGVFVPLRAVSSSSLSRAVVGPALIWASAV